MRTPGKELSHQLYSPNGLRCTLLHSIHCNQEANWQLIKQRKQALINIGNQKENRLKQSHLYLTGDNVLLKNAWKIKFNQYTYIQDESKGPYTVTEVRNNGTAHAHKGNVTDNYILRNITPFKE